MAATYQRLDIALVQRGLFDTRARAQAAIAAGLVFGDGAKLEKASARVSSETKLTARPAHPFVSRGGIKLSAALAHFGYNVQGNICLDVGASTGGFTDALLQAGAAHVYAVDVGHGQIHPSLAARSQVTLWEGLDARSLAGSMFTTPPRVVACDVSFISLIHVLPALMAVAAPQAVMVAMIKPQFEIGRRHLKKGIVRQAHLQAQACAEIEAFVTNLGWTVHGVIQSPITGGDGNQEFLLGAGRG